MEDHFALIPKDRLFLLHVYRTINLVIPKSSPMNGEFFVMLFKKIKTSDEKRKRILFKDAAIHKDPINDHGE